MSVAYLNISNAKLSTRDLTIEVPVDWRDPQRFGAISVFAREVVAVGRENEDLPLLLFLQGGPGGASPRPTGGGWLAAACKRYRVILLDQRGTGRSTPVSARTMQSFDGQGRTATESARLGAEYAACFRADSIVRDAEHLRKTVYGGRTWSTLGQSYGGFITLTYLSHAPEGLAASFVTAGIPSITASAEDVYRATFARQIQRNAELQAAYPEDVETFAEIADVIASTPVTLVDGDPLTVRRLQTLGMSLGVSDGADRLHWLLDTALDDGELSQPFLSAVHEQTSYWANPLYMVLHEVIYHQGERSPGWAASSVLSELPMFSASARPLMLTGEGVLPWQFEEQHSLRAFRGLAEELAARVEWPRLYDHDVLARNEVPLAAVLYEDDPYVDIELGAETMAHVGNSRLWRSADYLHDGLRSSGDVILPQLFEMVPLTRSFSG